MAVSLLLSGCALNMKVPIKDPVPSTAAYMKPEAPPTATLFFRDARSPESKKQPVTGRIPMQLMSPDNSPFEPVSWLAANTVKELVARGLPARLATDSSGAQTVVIRILQIENRRDSAYSPFKTFTSFSADVTIGTGTQRIATFIMRRKVPVWSFDEVIGPTYNDPLHLVAKELAAKLGQMLFDARLSDGQVDQLIARTAGPAVNSLDVYELGFGNNARAVPQLVKLYSAGKEGDVVRAAMSSLGVLRASQHLDLLVKEAESTENDWEDRAVALKAIGDLGTPQSRAYLEKVRSGLGALTDAGAARTNALIGLYLDE
jgi:hypothetical protein